MMSIPDSARVAEATLSHRPGYQTVPLRYLFRRRKVLGFIHEPMLSVFREYGVVLKSSRENLNKTAEDRSIYQLVDPGWLVVNRMKAWQGSVGVSELRGIVSGHYICFEPTHSQDSRYLNWLFRSDQYRTLFASISRGVRPGQIEIDNDDLQSLPVVLPPLGEQRRIAEFLDDQVGRIDRITEARRSEARSLDELIESEAYREVVGLGVRSPRVRSSIPWIESLPQDWGSPRIGLVARMGSGHTPSRSSPEYWVDCDIPWLTTSDVHRFRGDQIDALKDTVLHISGLGLANSAAVMHPAGTVALSRTASAGFSVIMGAEMATSQDFATWTCGPWLNNYYLLWCLRVMRRDLMGRLATGSTHKTIYFPELTSIRVPLPPVEYQENAAVRLRGLVDGIRATKQTLMTLVDSLSELKRSLVTSAVAGEFDISSSDGSRVVS